MLLTEVGVSYPIFLYGENCFKTLKKPPIPSFLLQKNLKIRQINFTFPTVIYNRGKV